jgi:hypothetical protein
MKDDECGWSEALFNGSTYFAQSSLPIWYGGLGLKEMQKFSLAHWLLIVVGQQTNLHAGAFPILKLWKLLSNVWARGDNKSPLSMCVRPTMSASTIELVEFAGCHPYSRKCRLLFVVAALLRKIKHCCTTWFQYLCGSSWFSLSLRVRMTLELRIFWVYFSNSTTMPCQPKGLEIHIYSRLLASQAYARC